MKMKQFNFTLRFALGAHDADPQLFVERLLAEGCDDALIGLGRPGRIALDFTREASSAADAILSALADVQRAIPEAKLVEATPDLVGLTDIANLLGCSRQYMRKLAVKEGAGFPPPVHEGKPAIWHLSTVLSWFADNKTREFDEALVEIARVNMQCNLIKEGAGVDRKTSDRFKALIV
jgi:hypothetical protein